MKTLDIPINAFHGPRRGARTLGTLLGITGVLGSCGGCRANEQRVQAAPPTPAAASPSVAGASASEVPDKLISLEALPPVEVPAPGAAVPSLSERGQTQIAAAEAQMREQRFTEAALELERALRYDPNHPDIHRTLALLHAQAGNRDRARVHVAKVLELRPDDRAAHYLEGRGHQMEGDQAAAITAFRVALACPAGPRDDDVTILAQYHLAEALQAEGYLTAALDAYVLFERQSRAVSAPGDHLEAATLRASAPVLLARARADILEELDRPAEAAQALTDAVRAAPEDADLAMRRARLFMKAGRLDDAVAAAGDIPPDAPGVLDLVMEIHRARGSTDELMADLRGRLNLRPGDAAVVSALADLLVQEGKRDAAVDLLREQARLHSGAVDIQLRLVDALRAAKRWDEMLRAAGEGLARHPAQAAEFERRVVDLRDVPEAVERAVAAAPDGAAPHDLYLRGVLARDTGRWEAAERLFHAAIAADANQAWAREALARLYYRGYDYAKALSVAARRDPEVAEDARLEFLLGEIHERMDDVGLAEFHWGAAVQLDRRSTEALFRLADLHARTERVLQAQRELRTLLEVEPNHEAGREMLAFLYLRQGKADPALQQFQELRKRAVTPALRARSDLLAAQFPRVDVDAYRAAILKAMEEAGPDAASWVIVADSYDEATDAAKRYEAYEAALRADPDHEEAALGLIGAARRLLRFEEAARRLELLLPRRPNRHQWRYDLIELYWNLQDYDRALALAAREEKRADLDDESRTGYRLRIVDSLRFANRKEESLAKLKEWADATGDTQWRRRLADMYQRDDRPGDAVVIFEELYKSGGGNKQPLNDLIEALGDAKRHDRAAQYALEWLAEDPTNDSAVALVAFALSAGERVDDTVELIRAHLAVTLNREFFQELLIRQLRIAKRYREAVQWVESLLDAAAMRMQAFGQRPRDVEASGFEDEIRRPNEPFTADRLAERIVELRVALAQAHSAARQFSDAERLLTEWLEDAEDPRHRVQYLHELSRCYQAQGQDVKSTETLEKVMAMVPGNVLISNDLAYGWIDQGIRLEEAEPLIRHALASAPREGAYLDTFGWLLYKKGEFAEARYWLSMASRERNEEDPVVLDHLGDTLWRLNEKEQATLRWEKAAANVAKMKEEELFAADLRRVRAGTAKKVEDAKAGREPAVAPLAQPAPVSP